MNTSSMILPLKLIEIGEPDANAEFYIAKKMGSTPVFIRAHYDAHFHGAEEFHNGTKFILYGQKGTGKTALLRSMEYKLSDKYQHSLLFLERKYWKKQN